MRKPGMLQCMGLQRVGHDSVTKQLQQDQQCWGNAKQIQSTSYYCNKLFCSSIISILKFFFWFHASELLKDLLLRFLAPILCLDETERRVVSENTYFPKCYPVCSGDRMRFLFSTASFHSANGYFIPTVWIHSARLAKWKWKWSRSVMSDSLRPHGL